VAERSVWPEPGLGIVTGLWTVSHPASGMALCPGVEFDPASEPASGPVSDSGMALGPVSDSGMALLSLSGSESDSGTALRPASGSGMTSGSEAASESESESEMGSVSGFEMASVPAQVPLPA